MDTGLLDLALSLLSRFFLRLSGTFLGLLETLGLPGWRSAIPLAIPAEGIFLFDRFRVVLCLAVISVVSLQ